MITNQNNTIKNISAKISVVNIEIVRAYIQGAVHSHCKNNPEKGLSVRILFGGDNKNWKNTPLQYIYEYYKYIRKSKKPSEQAAKDVGWILKSVLINDKRNFEYIGKDTGNIYKLIK